MKQRFLVFLLVWISQGCQLNHDVTQTSGQNVGATRTLPPNIVESLSERRFRDLFAFHLRESGEDKSSIYNAMFLTPEALLQAPSVKGRTNFLSSIDKHYQNFLPETLYDYGKENMVDYSVTPKTGSGPVTIIIFPGFLSEFIPFDVFEEVLANQNSIFAKRANSKIDGIYDEVYRVQDQKTIKLKLKDVVRFGSYDRNGASWVNVIMLTPKLGSLESLGKLTSSLDIYRRRLDKIFKSIDNLGNVYLLGFSRGGTVGLEFLRYMDSQSKEYPWAHRLRGLIGLGAVFFGSQSSDEGLSGKQSPQGVAGNIMRLLVENLEEEPSNLTGCPYALEAWARVRRNTTTWTTAISQMIQIEKHRSKSLMTPLQEEEDLRHVSNTPEIAGFMEKFELMRPILFELLNMKCPFKCYFQNIRALKQILHAFLEGAQDLTTDARMKWWAEAKLPIKYRILSLTATMPGPVKDGMISPILTASKYYGYTSPDFTTSRRPAYYDLIDFGGGPLNDSSVSLVRARYWSKLDPMIGRPYDNLGVLGVHHYGIAFPYAVPDKTKAPNLFPRSALMATIGSYLREYPDQFTGR